MIHEMSLQPEPFGKIESGAKTIELRLYDGKRQKIRIGDTIIYTSTKDEAPEIRIGFPGPFVRGNAPMERPFVSRF